MTNAEIITKLANDRPVTRAVDRITDAVADLLRVDRDAVDPEIMLEIVLRAVADTLRNV
jgi:hypothetical protein